MCAVNDELRILSRLHVITMEIKYSILGKTSLNSKKIISREAWAFSNLQ